MKPKDQDPKEMKSGVIYSFQCNHITCDEEYIKEDRQDPCRQMQGTPKTTLPLPHTHTMNRTHHYRRQFQHHMQGGPGAGQDH